MSDYITEQELLDYIKSGAETGNEMAQLAISAASRAVEAFTGRTFYQQETTTFYYSSYSPGQVSVQIDDLATASGLTVHVDGQGGTTYATALTINTQFVLEPVNQTFGGLPGWPYTRLRAVALGIFPVRYYPWQADTLKVTGTFGWAAVPDPVKQATKIIAAQYWKLSDAPFGVAGFGSYGEIRVRDIPQAATLLAPYRKGSSFGIA